VNVPSKLPEVQTQTSVDCLQILAGKGHFECVLEEGGCGAWRGRLSASGRLAQAGRTPTPHAHPLLRSKTSRHLNHRQELTKLDFLCLQTTNFVASWCFEHEPGTSHWK